MSSSTSNTPPDFSRIEFGLDAIDSFKLRAFDADGGLAFDRHLPAFLPTVTSLRLPTSVPLFRPTLEELYPAPSEFTPRDFASVYLFNWPPIVRLLPALKDARRLRNTPVTWLRRMVNKSMPALVRVEPVYYPLLANLLLLSAPFIVNTTSCPTPTFSEHSLVASSASRSPWRVRIATTSWPSCLVLQRSCHRCVLHTDPNSDALF